MQSKPQITFRDVKHSPQVEEYIHTKIEKLERFSAHIVSFQIVLSADTHHKRGSEHYQTHIKVSVPKKELVATQSKEENLYKSIDHAFDSIRRQLDDHDKKMSGH